MISGGRAIAIPAGRTKPRLQATVAERPLKFRRTKMIISGALIRSARALVEVSRKKLSIRSGVAEKDIAKFENQSLPLRDPDREALKDALEEFGAVFMPESNGRGVGCPPEICRRGRALFCAPGR